MKFPVDLLADVSQVELERLAHNYVNNLLYSNPDSLEHLTLSDSTQVTIDISSVGFVPLYGSSNKQMVLALFSPNDPFTAVALYLCDQWWAVDDILKTADSSRNGAVKVETVGERIVLYILNRVIYRAKEMCTEELPFLCHGEKENAKILWNNGEAVGFYSVKPSGSLCNSFSTRSYQLPVMDSIFVRKCQRGKGFGLQMLQDFVLTFKEDCLGLRYPLTKSMYKVCEKFLSQYPGDTDLLWEVESIGGPNQRTNIASKIQAMALTAVSKSLTFTEESLLISEETGKDLVMEAVTTQIKGTSSMECTVEIVEEVTVLRAAKVSEAVATRGRTSGPKERKMGEKVREDKSEKVIRIEDIEAETPGEEGISPQLKTELHNVSELVQNESVFSVAREVIAEDADEAVCEEAAMMSKTASALASQGLEEADVALAPTKDKQVKDDATQALNIISYDSQIMVENVASEIEEAEEKEDTAMLLVSEEVLEEGSLDKVGEVTDKSEERVTQHKVSVSPHAASEDGEVGKTGRTVIKAINTVQSETPRRRSQRHSRPKEKVKEETAAQSGGRVLRGRTIMKSSPTKRKYARHSQKVCEKLENKVDEVAEENEVSPAKVVEVVVTKGEEPEEISSIKGDVVEQVREKQQLTDKEVDDTVVKGSLTECLDIAETGLAKESEDENGKKAQKGVEVETSVIKDKPEVSDDETEDSPIVHKTALRGRHKITLNQCKRHQRQEEEHTDETDLEAGGLANRSEEKATAQTVDKEMDEHQTKEQEETINKTEEETSIEELTVVEEGTIPKTEKVTEEVIPLIRVNSEENKEVQEEEETGGEMETVSAMEADKEEEADDMVKEADTVTAVSETAIPHEVLEEAATAVVEEPQEEDNGSEIPKLQKATVILWDLKATCHHLKMKETEETVDEEWAATEKELRAAEEKELSSCVVEQTPELEMLVLTEEDGGKQETSTDTSVNATAEAETAKKEQLEKDGSDKEKEESAGGGGSKVGEAPVIETRVLRSRRRMVDESCRSTCRSTQLQDKSNQSESMTEKEVVELEMGADEVEAMAKDAITVTVLMDEKQPAVSEICAETEAVKDDAECNLPTSDIDEALCVEAPVTEMGVLKIGPKTVTVTRRHKATRSKRQANEQEAESIDEETEVTRTLRGGRISVSATPKGKSRRTYKQIEGEEHKASKNVEEMGVVEEKAVKEATVGKTEKDIVLKIEEELGEKVQPVFINQKQLRKKERGSKESAVETEVEEDEAGLGSAKKLPTEGDEGKAQEENKIKVEKEEPVTLEVLKAVSEDGTMLMAEEEVKIGVTAAADNVDVQDGEADTILPKPTTYSSVFTQSEKEATLSLEEQQNEEMAPQLSDLQRVTVVLVDLKKTHLDIHEQTGAVKEGIPEGKTDAEAEREQREETMAEEYAPGSPVVIEKNDLDKVVVEKELLEEKIEYVVTIQETEEGRAEKTAEEDVAKSVDEKEEEAVDTKTRTRGRRKRAFKDTPRCKLTISRQEKGEEEKGASEIREAEPAVHVRFLKRGRKSVPLTQRCKTKRTQKQLLEEEVGEESIIKEQEAEDDEEKAEDQEHTIDLEKGATLEEKDATLQAGKIDLEMTVEKVDIAEVEAIKKDAPEKGQAGSTLSDTEENPEAPSANCADEEKTAYDVAEEAVTMQDTVEREQLTSTSTMAETTAGENAQVTLMTAKDGETKDASEEKEMPVETKERSGEKTLRATTKSKTTKRQEDEQEEEVIGKKSTQDEPAVETGVLRNGRRFLAATPRRKSNRACKLRPFREEGEVESTPAEETQLEQTKEDLEDVEEKEESRDEKTEERKEVEAAEVVGEMGKLKAVAEELLTEQETVQEEEFFVLGTCADGHGEAYVRERVNKTPNTDDGKVPGEDEAPTVEPRVLRCVWKTGKVTPISKSTKRQSEGKEQEGTVEEKSAGKGEPAGETRVLRNGRRTAPATPRRKYKRAHTHCLLEEEKEETTTEGEKEEAGQELLEENREMAEEKGKSMEMEKKDMDVEQEVQSTTEGESAVGDADQMKVALTEETVVLEKDKINMATVDELGNYTAEISSAKGEETNSGVKKETTVIDKSTAATELGCDTAVAKEEVQMALGEYASAVAEEEAPAVTTRPSRKTKTSHATPLRRSRRQKDQGIVETQQQEEETPEDDKAQEVHQLTDVSLENGEQNAMEQPGMEEISPAGQRAGPSAEDTATTTDTEDQVKKNAELKNNRVVGPGSDKEEQSENKDKTLNSSVVDRRNLRRRMKTDADKEEDKTQRKQLPKRRSIRKKPRVDYRESDEEDEGGETEVTTDREEDNKMGLGENIDTKKAEFSAKEFIEKLEERFGEEKLENNKRAIESTGEKGNAKNVVLDTDIKAEMAGMSQGDKEDERNVSDEKMEPIVIGQRDLRGRSFPSVLITPQYKFRHCSANGKEVKKSMSDEEKSPQSSQKRSLRKRRSPELIPIVKSKRHSRV